MDAYVPSARLRQQDEDFDTEMSQVTQDDLDGAESLLLQTATQTTYPTAANKFYYCKVMAVLGSEVEGGAATITDTGKRVLAYNAGASVPPSGTNVEARFLPYRWVFRYP